MSLQVSRIQRVGADTSFLRQTTDLSPRSFLGKRWTTSLASHQLTSTTWPTVWTTRCVFCFCFFWRDVWSETDASTPVAPNCSGQDLWRLQDGVHDEFSRQLEDERFVVLFLLNDGTCTDLHRSRPFPQSWSWYISSHVALQFQPLTCRSSDSSGKPVLRQTLSGHLRSQGQPARSAHRAVGQGRRGSPRRQSREEYVFDLRERRPSVADLCIVVSQLSGITRSICATTARKSCDLLFTMTVRISSPGYP